MKFRSFLTAGILVMNFGLGTASLVVDAQDGVAKKYEQKISSKQVFKILIQSVKGLEGELDLGDRTIYLDASKFTFLEASNDDVSKLVLECPGQQLPDLRGEHWLQAIRSNKVVIFDRYQGFNTFEPLKGSELWIENASIERSDNESVIHADVVYLPDNTKLWCDNDTGRMLLDRSGAYTFQAVFRVGNQSIDGKISGAPMKNDITVQLTSPKISAPMENQE